MGDARRNDLAPAAAILLPIVVGVAWFLWHSRVRSCGFHGLKGEPDFPATLALIALGPVAPAATAIRGVLERRPARAIVLLAIVAVALTAVAIVVAELAFFFHRRCYE